MKVCPIKATIKIFLKKFVWYHVVDTNRAVITTSTVFLMKKLSYNIYTKNSGRGMNVVYDGVGRTWKAINGEKVQNLFF